MADTRGAPTWLVNLRAMVGDKRGDRTRVAAEAGMPLSQLQLILNGRNQKPQIDTLERIAVACERTLEDLFSRPGQEAGRDATGNGRAGGGTRIEDRLGDLLAYIKTLEGQARTDFIRAIIALLTAIEHARPAASSGAAPDDER